jgi:hypothetical protein
LFELRKAEKLFCFSGAKWNFSNYFSVQVSGACPDVNQDYFSGVYPEPGAGLRKVWRIIALTQLSSWHPESSSGQDPVANLSSSGGESSMGFFPSFLLKEKMQKFKTPK